MWRWLVGNKTRTLITYGYASWAKVISVEPVTPKYLPTDFPKTTRSLLSDCPKIAYG